MSHSKQNKTKSLAENNESKNNNKENQYIFFTSKESENGVEFPFSL